MNEDGQMKHQLQDVVNAWYKQWTKLHDPFNDDFEKELYEALPYQQFTLDVRNDYWILIGER